MMARFRLDMPVSLATRVVFLLGLTLVLSFILLGIVIDRSIQHHFAQQDANELNVVADSVADKLQRVHPNADIMDIQTTLKQAVTGHHGVYFAVYLPNQNRVLYETQGSSLLPLINSSAQHPISPDSLLVWQSESHVYRGASRIGYMLDAYPVRILVAGNMDFHIDFLQRFRKTLWFILSTVWLIAMVSVWWAVRLGHRPLTKVSREIRDISADNLHIRLQTKTLPDELKELVEAFNTRQIQL
jgi:two-component system heavy metal sensor histidine kinase CusS